MVSMRDAARRIFADGKSQMKACVAVAISAFLVGSHISGASLIGMVDRWQTLLTGVFAVWAASLTVKRMSIIDLDQGRRHRELVALQLRVDALIIGRACIPHAALIDDSCASLDQGAEMALAAVDRIQTLSESFTVENPLIDDWYAAAKAYDDALANVRASHLKLITSLSNGDLDKAEPLFDPNISIEYKLARDSANRMSEALAANFEGRDKWETFNRLGMTSDIAMGMAGRAMLVVQAVAVTTPAARKFSTSLKTLWAKYEADSLAQSSPL